MPTSPTPAEPTPVKLRATPVRRYVFFAFFGASMRALREQMKAALETMDNTVASVLTPEQKSKLEALRAARPHGKFPGGPPSRM